MKRYFVAAGALLLGTSMLGLAASAQTSEKDMVAAKLATMDKSVIAAKSDMPTDTKVETSSVEPLPADKAALLGMGGPEEPVMVAGGADFTPRLAAQNYPPCRPGPGDDRCIQLYEPGVRQALASWNRPTGGLAGRQETAMGGPYDPAN